MILQGLDRAVVELEQAEHFTEVDARGQSQSKVSQAHQDQQPGQRLTLHWSPSNGNPLKMFGNFCICQVDISISQKSCTWFVLFLQIFSPRSIYPGADIRSEFFFCEIERGRFSRFSRGEASPVAQGSLCRKPLLPNSNQDITKCTATPLSLQTQHCQSSVSGFLSAEQSTQLAQFFALCSWEAD